MKNKILAAATATVMLLGFSNSLSGFVNAQSLSEEEKYANAPAPVIASKTMPEDYSTEAVPFQSTIDEFYRQVKIKPIDDEFEGIYADNKGHGYSMRNLEIDGIPLYEVKKDDGKLKPLIIQIHGGGGSKRPFHYSEMFQEGACVVSIDCAGSGESQDGPLQAPAAWMETVKDIDVLIEYYNTVPDVDATNFGLLGFSMGGNISEYYTVYGKYKPTAICLENSSADLTHEGPTWDCFDKGKNGQTPIWTEEQMWSFTAATAPIKHPECFKDIWMYICVGELDNVHSPQKMEEFKNIVAALGNENIVFHSFEGVGHEYPSEEWINNERKDFFVKLVSNTYESDPETSNTEASEPSNTEASEPSNTEASEPSNTEASEPSGTKAPEPTSASTSQPVVTVDVTNGVQNPSNDDKNSPDTGVESVAAVVGISVIAAGAVIVSKKKR